MVCKPNSVCSDGKPAKEAAIYLCDLPIVQARRSGSDGGLPPSIPEGMDCTIYAVLHQVGFVVSRTAFAVKDPFQDHHHR